MALSAPRSPATPPAVANFDGVARLYRWAEYLLLGPLLKRCREHFLPALATCRCALVLGDGDGRFTAAMVRRHPQLYALVVDASRRMLDLTWQRTGFARDRVRLRQAALPGLRFAQEELPRPPDAIVTHFFLDCLEQDELEELARQIAKLCSPGALWLVSDFAIPPSDPWRWLAAGYVHMLYAAFGFLTGLQARSLPDVEKALQGAGFSRLDRHDRLRGMLYSELWRQHGSPSAERADATSAMPATSTLV